ncbi:MAG TPA: hypothetical protein VGE21_13000 [Flavobacteriales bacterium]
MPFFVTIAEFVLPSDLVIARSRLEHEGIECQVQDELTVQVNNLWSNAVGGVKLQVPSEDAERARAFLKEWGFLREGVDPPAGFWLKLDAWTRDLPLVGRMDLLIARLTVIMVPVLALLIVLAWLLLSPSLTEKLAGTTWCIEEVVHDGIFIEPRSLPGSGAPFVQMIYEGCSETLDFDRSGSVKVPGFDTPASSGTWIVDGSRLRFMYLVDERGIFAEAFKVSMDRDHLQLRSARTTIMCRSLQLGW